MKLVRFFLKGVLLAVLTIFSTMVIEILLYVLSFSFSFLHPLVVGMGTDDPTNPWAYFIMLPAIALSLFFSRGTNSLKEAFLKGFGWAAIQFGMIVGISAIGIGLQGALEQFTVYLFSLGAFVGPLMNYIFREFRNKAPKEKKGVIIAMITIILFCVGVPFLYLYSTRINNDSNISSTSLNTIGNTGGNLANGGKAALQGDWIYYSNQYMDTLGLYKIKTDGTGKTKLSDDNATFINVEGDWIYYINGNVDSIYKIKTDGTEKTNLSDDNVTFMNVVGDWIYYSNGSDHRKLYKIKTDGHEQEKLSDDSAFSVNVVGDWIYYCNAEESPPKGSGEIYKIKTDGTERTKISDDNAFSLNVVGDWIYYINGNVGSIYRIKTDGTEKIKLVDDLVANINVAGDWIYYSTQSRNTLGLYKIKTDGTGKTKLSGDSVASINVVGDWIYYENYGGDFKIRTDGLRRGGV